MPIYIEDDEASVESYASSDLSDIYHQITKKKVLVCMHALRVLCILLLSDIENPIISVHGEHFHYLFYLNKFRDLFFPCSQDYRNQGRPPETNKLS